MIFSISSSLWSVTLKGLWGERVDRCRRTKVGGPVNVTFRSAHNFLHEADSSDSLSANLGALLSGRLNTISDVAETALVCTDCTVFVAVFLRLGGFVLTVVLALTPRFVGALQVMFVRFAAFAFPFLGFRWRFMCGGLTSG